ncbi:MAG TPA: hypothetical protein VFF30_13710 [Nitrososphaerales archaeon]|nr:hypothetical protein [Nitrososphaerales archaeon]
MTQATTKEIEKGTLLGESKEKYQTYGIKEVTPFGFKYESYAADTLREYSTPASATRTADSQRTTARLSGSQRGYCQRQKAT